MVGQRGRASAVIPKSLPAAGRQSDEESLFDLRFVHNPEHNISNRFSRMQKKLLITLSPRQLARLHANRTQSQSRRRIAH